MTGSFIKPVAPITGGGRALFGPSCQRLSATRTVTIIPGAERDLLATNAFASSPKPITAMVTSPVTGRVINLTANFAAQLAGLSPDVKDKWCSFISSERPHALMITNHGYAGPTFPPAAQDSGGQIEYVNSVAKELSVRGYKVTIATRGFRPADHLEYGDRRGISFFPEEPNVRYLYVPGNLEGFVSKEQIYPELPLIGNNLASFLEFEAAAVGSMPWNEVEFINSHYVDGGVVGQFLVRNWHNLMARAHLNERLSEVLPNNFMSIDDNLLSNMPYKMGCHFIREWGASSQGQRIYSNNPEDVLAWVGNMLQWPQDRIAASIDRLKRDLSALSVEQRGYASEFCLGNVVLDEAGDMPQLIDKLGGTNRHIWTPHSLSPIKEKNFLDANPSTTRNPDYYALHFAERRTFEMGLISGNSGPLLGAMDLIGLPPIAAIVSTSPDISHAYYTLGGAPEIPQISFPPALDLTKRFQRSNVDDPEVRAFFEHLREREIIPPEMVDDMMGNPQKYNLLVEASRMDATKRKYLLVEAMQYLPENTILFVTGARGSNDGIYGELLEKIHSLDMQHRIFLLGSVPSEFIGVLEGLPQGPGKDQFASVIGVSASRMEGWGMAVHEMAAGGYPIVSSDRVPVAKYIDAREPGAVKIVTMSGNEPQKYASAIRALNENLAGTRDAAVRSVKVAKEFTWKDLTGQFLERIDVILPEKVAGDEPRTLRISFPAEQETPLGSTLVNKTYVVVLAGGVGARMRPYSTDEQPKQFRKIIDDDRTMIQTTVGRFTGTNTMDRIFPVSPEKVMIVTNDVYRELAREQLPDIPPPNIIGEPQMKNTGPAIATAMYKIASQEPDASVVVVAADHFMDSSMLFLGHVSEALRVTQQHGVLATFGIQPEWASPEYGYIKVGEVFDDARNAFKVERFVEKPQSEVAKLYLDDGGYLWNSGMFVWTAPAFMDALKEYQPVWNAGLENTYGKLSADQPIPKASMLKFYDSLMPRSIDYGLMEPAAAKGRVVVVPMRDLIWSDVGTWPSLARLVQNHGVTAPPEVIQIMNEQLRNGGDKENRR